MSKNKKILEKENLEEVNEEFSLKSLLNLFGDMGINFNDPMGTLKFDNMVSIVGRGFSLDIPENYTVDRDIEGKEIIAYEKEYDEYTDAPMHIQVGLQELNPGLTEENFVDVMKNTFDKTGIEYNIFNVNGKKIIESLQPGVFGPPISHIAIYNGDCYYQVRITFNGNYENSEEIKNMIINSFKTINNFDTFISERDIEIEKQKRELVGRNGKINALYVLKLFQEDVVFFNEGEIGYNGKKHYMQGIQFNSGVIDNYEVVRGNLQTVANGIADIVEYIENNKDLRKALSDIDESLHEFLQDEDMTGFTLMNLFTYKLMILKQQNDSEIIVLADTRITSGIPKGENYIKELINTLLKYNEIDSSNININILGMRNFDI